MDGKVFVSRHSRHFLFQVAITNLHFPIWNMNYHVNKYFARQGKGTNRRNGSTNLLIVRAHDFNQSLFHSSYDVISNVFPVILSIKIFESSTLIVNFSTSENGNSEN